MEFNCIDNPCGPCVFRNPGKEVAGERAEQLARVAERLKLTTAKHPNDILGLFHEAEPLVASQLPGVDADIESQYVVDALVIALTPRPDTCEATHAIN